MVMMNIIRKLRDLRKAQIAGAKAALLLIPTSRLAGIDALPVELWSLIIEAFVVDKLSCSHLQGGELPDILNTRLVCRVFDKEVQHALHQHISLPQLPYHAFNRTVAYSSQALEKEQELHITLFASALYNSCRSSSSSRRHVRRPRIADRIQNCTIIAAHMAPTYRLLPSYHNSLPFYLLTGATSLMHMFCYSATTSKYCQQYMSMPSYYDAEFKSCAEGDAYLEAALLVACGYPIEEVKRWMVSLARKGSLVRYRRGGRQYPGINDLPLYSCRIPERV